MSIGNIASHVWGPSARPLPSASPKPDGAAPAPPSPSLTRTGLGTADPSRQLSADVQARLLQFQAANATPGGAATPAAFASPVGTTKAPLHHHRHGGDTDPGASGGLVPAQTASGPASTAGAAASSGADAANTALLDTIRQAVKAYAASGSAVQANLTTSLATA